MPPVLIPQSEPHTFTLNVSGIAGFLGGEEAVSAMESVHFYEHRKYLGIYNTPGSYTVAKHYGKLANSQLWDGLYPGVNEEPAKFLKMDGQRGPRFIGAVSGTMMDDVGHIGYIFGQLCHQDLKETEVKADRKTSITGVTVVDFEGRDPNASQIKIPVKYPATFSSTPVRHIIALGTILFSIGACVVCGVFHEWYAFALILLGIVCNGIACYLIGSAKMFLKRPIPSPHSPPGNGILDDQEREQFVVLRGSQQAVNYIVRGRFVVEYGSHSLAFHRIGISASALTIQFIAQLFLIPQSGLFGQILFLATLAVSWVNNACLSSIDKESIQKQILKQNAPLQDPVGEKYMMPTRTAAVVFAMLCALPLEFLVDKAQEKREKYIQAMLGSLLPTGTDEWNEWAELVSKKISELVPLSLEKWGQRGYFDLQKHQGLLQHLLGDTNLAMRKFLEISSKH